MTRDLILALFRPDLACSDVALFHCTEKLRQNNTRIPTMIQNPDLFNTVQTYFDGLFYCDPEKLNAVFHKNSSLFDAESGEIFAEPIAPFIRDVGLNEPNSPANLGQAPESEMLMIDWLSPKCVTVKIRIRAREKVYQDHLGIVKGSDGWKIVSKIWFLERTIE